MEKTSRKSFSQLFRSKRGKLISIIALTLMMITASASVFENYYVNSTGTVQNSALTLVAGSDASVSCSTYPCATVTVASTNDYATLAFSFAKSATNTPQPATYYTNLTLVHATASGHTLTSVMVIPTITATSGADFGKITVYYCSSQTDDPATNCANSLAITSTGSTGTVFSGADALSSGDNRYIEVVAYAGTGATTGDQVSFNIQIQWS